MQKIKIKFLSDMRARIQTIPTGLGGGSNCFSREVRTSFSSRKQMATYNFMGRSGPPAPSGGGGGGGEGRIASRGRFVPVFLLGNKWQLMIFMGRSGPPAPSVSAHIRVSNSLNSHFIYFIFCWAWSIHKTSANYIS